MLLGSAGGLSLVSGVTHALAPTTIATFVISGLTLGVLAALVGRSVDRLGDRLGATGTGVLQGGLGNLPELFFSIFALRARLVVVVQAAIVGSILGNLLLVLGAAFVVGGVRHGVQRFSAEAARNAALLLSLAVAILVVPTVSSHLTVPAGRHERALSDVAAVVLLAVLVLASVWSWRASRRQDPAATEEVAEVLGEAQRPSERPSKRWPLPLALGMLVAASLLAALVSDWFVTALAHSLVELHVGQSFAGLVIVAIAGNAVEHVVGVSLAAQNRMDYALSAILQSPIQIAFGLLPALVLLSYAIGGSPLTLVLPPLDLIVLVLGTVVTVIVVFDGESNWLEGVVLIGLYVTIAPAFWWG